MKKLILQSFEEEYKTFGTDNSEFESLYHYLLYVCGGDFSLFDNEDRVFAIIMEHNLRFTAPII
jgi:hypothetical protein